MGRQVLGTPIVFSANVFANPVASLSAPYPQELTQWDSSIEDPQSSIHGFATCR